MFYNYRPRVLLYPIFYAAICLCIVGGCDSAHYKADADKEVYGIIENKWDPNFGEKGNYLISDVRPAANDIQIEKIMPSSGVLNLAQAVAIATAYNRDYQTQKENLYLVALELTLERHQFARQWFGTIDSKYSKDADDEQLSSNSDFGFNQLLADGAIISTNIAIDWARFLTGDPQTSLGSVLSASITQPLLRGAGRKIAQENLTQAERDVLYEIRFFNRFRKTFVVSIVTDYYRVLQRRNEVINAENNYQRRLESKIRMEMEAQAGRVPYFEVDQAEQRLLSAKDSQVSSIERYEQFLDEFKIRLSLPTEAEIELDQNELKALEKIGISEPDYSLNAATEIALLSRLDLANSMDMIDDAVRKIIVASDNLRGELNLVGSTAIGSAGKTNFGKLQFQEGLYEVGLEADLPFDRKAERNSYRRTLIILERFLREYDNNVDEIKLDVRQAYRQLEEEAESYYIQENSLELAEKRVESTELLLKAGRAIARDLLESQDDLLEAQNKLTDSLVSHAIAKLNFFRDIGILQVKPDGMWVQ